MPLDLGRRCLICDIPRLLDSIAPDPVPLNLGFRVALVGGRLLDHTAGPEAMSLDLGITRRRRLVGVWLIGIGGLSAVSLALDLGVGRRPSAVGCST